MKKQNVQKEFLDKKSKYARVGWILGIVAICTSIISVGALVAIPGIVFSVLGFKTPSPVYYRKARTGLILSIIAIVIGVTLAVVGGYFLAKWVYEFGGKPGGC